MAKNQESTTYREAVELDLDVIRALEVEAELDRQLMSHYVKGTPPDPGMTRAEQLAWLKARQLQLLGCTCSRAWLDCMYRDLGHMVECPVAVTGPSGTPSAPYGELDRAKYPKFKPTTLDAAQPLTWGVMAAALDNLWDKGHCAQCADGMACDRHPDLSVPEKYR